MVLFIDSYVLMLIINKHRHIVELGLTLLHQASLPLHFWDYAFTTAVYLINRLPTVSLQFVVPFSVLFHKNPDYHFFFKLLVAHVFLCYDLIKVTNLTSDLKSVCFLVIHIFTRDTSVWLLVGASLSLKMFYLMNRDFLILSCFLSLLILLKI